MLPEQDRFHEVPTIRHGIKIMNASGKEFPRNVDYIRTRDSDEKILFPEIEAAYGVNPQKLTVYLVKNECSNKDRNEFFRTNNHEAMFENYKVARKFHQGKSLVCVSFDGTSAHRLQNRESSQRETIPCAGWNCEYYRHNKNSPLDMNKRGCALRGEIFFQIQGIPEQVYKIDHASYHSHMDLIHLIRSASDFFNGNVAFIPFVLSVKTIKVSYMRQGKKESNDRTPVWSLSYAWPPERLADERAIRWNQEPLRKNALKMSNYSLVDDREASAEEAMVEEDESILNMPNVRAIMADERIRKMQSMLQWNDAELAGFAKYHMDIETCGAEMQKLYLSKKANPSLDETLNEMIKGDADLLAYAKQVGWTIGKIKAEAMNTGGNLEAIKAMLLAQINKE